MPVWKVNLRVGRYIDSESDATLQERAEGIDRAFRSQGVYRRMDEDDELWLAVDELKDAAKDEDVEWYNSCLSAIYDWCDRERVWLEPNEPRSPEAPIVQTHGQEEK